MTISKQFRNNRTTSVHSNVIFFLMINALWCLNVLYRFRSKVFLFCCLFVSHFLFFCLIFCATYIYMLFLAKSQNLTKSTAVNGSVAFCNSSIDLGWQDKIARSLIHNSEGFTEINSYWNQLHVFWCFMW